MKSIELFSENISIGLYKYPMNKKKGESREEYIKRLGVTWDKIEEHFSEMIIRFKSRPTRSELLDLGLKVEITEVSYHPDKFDNVHTPTNNVNQHASYHTRVEDGPIRWSFGYTSDLNEVYFNAIETYLYELKKKKNE